MILIKKILTIMKDLIEELKEIRMLIENEELEEAIEEIDSLIYKHGESGFIYEDS